MANVSSSNGIEKYPKLRFPGFDEPWEIHPAEELFESVVDKNHPDDTVLTIIQGSGTLPRSESSRNIRYDENGVANYKRVNTYDYIIHLRSFEGGLEMANSQGIISPAYTVLRSKKEFAPLFYDAYFHTDEFINHVLSKSVEGIRDGRQISYEAFKWLGIPSCSLAEQTKISNIFSLLQSRIEKQQALVNYLKKYKRGVIQRTLKGNWQKARFGDFITEHNIRTSDTVTMPLVSLTVENGITPKTDRYNREFLVTKEGDSYKEIHQGWFGYNPMNAHIGAIAANHLGYNASVSGYYNVFSVNEPDTIGFWEEFLISYPMLCHYKLIATGSLIEKQRVHFSQFVDIKMALPTLDEQRKLSQLYSSLNNKIVAEQNILYALYSIRCGLLQRLFI